MEAARRYSAVVQTAREKYGNRFGIVKIDFPMENECNSAGQARSGGLHLAACEAAAAVRLARMTGIEREREVEEWLWLNQASLTPQLVFDGLKEKFGMDLRAEYAGLLPDVAKDAQSARLVGVRGTPTFFLNGRRLPLLPAALMEIAIESEMRKSNLAKKVGGLHTLE